MAALEVRITERQLDKTKVVITENTLHELFAEFKGFVTSRNIPAIKKFIVSYDEKVIIYNEHVEVLFKLDTAGISLDGTDFDAFAATVTKKDLYGMNQDAV